jgi:hypothetical protein
LKLRPDNWRCPSNYYALVTGWTSITDEDAIEMEQQQHPNNRRELRIIFDMVSWILHLYQIRGKIVNISRRLFPLYFPLAWVDI